MYCNVWANILGETSLQRNFNTGFNNNQTEVIIHLSQWQYWWWFWFFLLWVIYFYLIARIFTRRAIYFNPTLNTSMQSHGKWGDFLISVIPVFWCFNILVNSNFILRMIEWQNENSIFTLKIQGKQWYWVYKYNTDTTQRLSALCRKIGTNNSIALLGDDIYTTNSFFAGVNASSRFEYMNDWENLREAYFKTNNLFDTQEFIVKNGGYTTVTSRNLKKNIFVESFYKEYDIYNIDFIRDCFYLRKDHWNFFQKIKNFLNEYKKFKNEKIKNKKITNEYIIGVETSFRKLRFFFKNLSVYESTLVNSFKKMFRIWKQFTFSFKKFSETIRISNKSKIYQRIKENFTIDIEQIYKMREKLNKLKAYKKIKEKFTIHKEQIDKMGEKLNELKNFPQTDKVLLTAEMSNLIKKLFNNEGNFLIIKKKFKNILKPQIITEKLNTNLKNFRIIFDFNNIEKKIRTIIQEMRYNDKNFKIIKQRFIKSYTELHEPFDNISPKFKPSIIAHLALETVKMHKVRKLLSNINEYNKLKDYFKQSRLPSICNTFTEKLKIYRADFFGRVTYRTIMGILNSGNKIQIKNYFITYLNKFQKMNKTYISSKKFKDLHKFIFPLKEIIRLRWFKIYAFNFKSRDKGLKEWIQIIKLKRVLNRRFLKDRYKITISNGRLLIGFYFENKNYFITLRKINDVLNPLFIKEKFNITVDKVQMYMHYIKNKKKIQEIKEAMSINLERYKEIQKLLDNWKELYKPFETISPIQQLQALCKSVVHMKRVYKAKMLLSYVDEYIQLRDYIKKSNLPSICNTFTEKLKIYQSRFGCKIVYRRIIHKLNSTNKIQIKNYFTNYSKNFQKINKTYISLKRFEELNKFILPLKGLLKSKWFKNSLLYLDKKEKEYQILKEFFRIKLNFKARKKTLIDLKKINVVERCNLLKEFFKIKLKPQIIKEKFSINLKNFQVLIDYINSKKKHQAIKEKFNTILKKLDIEQKSNIIKEKLNTILEKLKEKLKEKINKKQKPQETKEKDDTEQKPQETKEKDSTKQKANIIKEKLQELKEKIFKKQKPQETKEKNDTEQNPQETKEKDDIIKERLNTILEKLKEKLREEINKKQNPQETKEKDDTEQNPQETKEKDDTKQNFMIIKEKFQALKKKFSINLKDFLAFKKKTSIHLKDFQVVIDSCNRREKFQEFTDKFDIIQKKIQELKKKLSEKQKLQAIKEKLNIIWEKLNIIWEKLEAFKESLNTIQKKLQVSKEKIKEKINEEFNIAQEKLEGLKARIDEKIFLKRLSGLSIASILSQKPEEIYYETTWTSTWTPTAWTFETTYGFDKKNKYQIDELLDELLDEVHLDEIRKLEVSKENLDTIQKKLQVIKENFFEKIWTQTFEESLKTTQEKLQVIKKKVNTTQEKLQAIEKILTQEFEESLKIFQEQLKEEISGNQKLQATKEEVSDKLKKYQVIINNTSKKVRLLKQTLIYMRNIETAEKILLYIETYKAMKKYFEETIFPDKFIKNLIIYDNLKKLWCRIWYRKFLCGTNFENKIQINDYFISSSERTQKIFEKHSFVKIFKNKKKIAIQSIQFKQFERTISPLIKFSKTNLFSYYLQEIRRKKIFIQNSTKLLNLLKTENDDLINPPGGGEIINKNTYTNKIKTYLNKFKLFNVKFFHENKVTPSLKYFRPEYISLVNLIPKLYDKTIKNQQQIIFEDESPQDFNWKIKLVNNNAVKCIKIIPTILNKHILQNIFNFNLQKNKHLLCNLFLEKETGSFVENERRSKNSNIIRQKKIKRKDFLHYRRYVDYNSITMLPNWQRHIDKDKNVVWERRMKKEISKSKYRMYRDIRRVRKNTELIPIELAKRLLRVRRTLMLPVHNNITIITNSYDVVHSWFVPGLGLKLDCVPGRSTHHSFYVDNVGFYYGQCAEICGRYHHHMPIRVCALPFEHFMFWWQKRGLKRLSKKQLNNVYDNKLKNLAKLEEEKQKYEAKPDVIKEKRDQQITEKEEFNDLLESRLKSKFWKWIPLWERKSVKKPL